MLAHLAICGSAISLAAGKQCAIDLWLFRAHLSTTEELLSPSNNPLKTTHKMHPVGDPTATHKRYIREKQRKLSALHLSETLLKTTTETTKSSWLFHHFSAALPVTHHWRLAWQTAELSAVFLWKSHVLSNGRSGCVLTQPSLPYILMPLPSISSHSYRKVECQAEQGDCKAGNKTHRGTASAHRVISDFTNKAKCLQWSQSGISDVR